MFDFNHVDLEGEALAEALVSAADAITADEPDSIANMANVSAILMQFMGDLNWVGFYRVVGDELVLGPFQGKAACIRIAHGQGVCGAALATAKTQRVADVHDFPGHIACDADSRAELVVPVIRDGTVIAVIDLDSPRENRFSEADGAMIERLATLIASRI
jgi:L-methionine (R)-S-oxide reductase